MIRRAGRAVGAVLGSLRSGPTGAVRPVLVIAGLVMFSLAAWSVGVGLGLAVAGVCCFTLDYLLTSDDADGVDPNVQSNNRRS